MGFAEAEPETEEVNLVREAAEQVLLIGFMGGIRCIKDECRVLEAEHDVLLMKIDPEELMQVMENVDATVERSEEDVRQAVDVLTNLIETTTPGPEAVEVTDGDTTEN